MSCSKVARPTFGTEPASRCLCPSLSRARRAFNPPFGNKDTARRPGDGTNKARRGGNRAEHRRRGKEQNNDGDDILGRAGGGYYPCADLDEGGGVLRHAISTYRRRVLQPASYTTAYMRSTALLSWCLAPRNCRTYPRCGLPVYPSIRKNTRMHRYEGRLADCY